jgi:CheY-like chemotaxis protein
MASPLSGMIGVMDDEPRFVRGLAGLLRRDGYRVGTAGQGARALAQLQALGGSTTPRDVPACSLMGRHSLYDSHVAPCMLACIDFRAFWVHPHFSDLPLGHPRLLGASRSGDPVCLSLRRDASQCERTHGLPPPSR